MVLLITEEEERKQGSDKGGQGLSRRIPRRKAKIGNPKTTIIKRGRRRLHLLRTRVRYAPNK